MKCITLAQLIEFHRRITIKTGGSDGVRDKGLLESALNRPFAKESVCESPMISISFFSVSFT